MSYDISHMYIHEEAKTNMIGDVWICYMHGSKILLFKIIGFNQVAICLKPTVFLFDIKT